MELHMYSICAYINYDFVKKVEKAFFLENGYGALFLTTEEHLYAVGRIFSSTLGLGRHFIPKELTKVAFPKDVKIINFATRGIYCAALSIEGTVFHWGGSMKTPHSVFCLRDLCAIQISCGENFLMALCTNGQVWAWRGTKFCSFKITPRDEDMVEADYSPNVIKMVGIFRPVLLTKSGKIYIPNQSFTATVAPFTYLTRSIETISPMEKIVKLACGKFRVFALCEGGVLYSWNEYSCSGTITPERVICDLGRFTDLRAPLDTDEVITADSTGKLHKIFMGSGGKKIWSPVEVKNSSFNEYEAAGNLSSYGLKESLEIPVKTSEESRLSRVKWLRRFMDAFNSPENSDVTFVVQGNIIYAHQVLLSIQCQKLKRSFENEYKGDSNRIVMPIQNVSHSTFYRFIKFFYNGQLDIGSPKGNIELLKLVHFYEYEPLMKLCEEILIRGTKEDNACSLYMLASSIGLRGLKNNSLAFIREHQGGIEKLGLANQVTGILESEGNECPVHQ